MLRIHFTARDLSRVRVVRLGPLALAQLAAPAMAARDDDHLYGRWRAEARARLTPRAVDTASWLFPYREMQVDLITLAGAEATAEEAAENLLALSQPQLNAELGLARLRGRRPPPWLRQLVAGDHEARQDLVLALQELRHAALAGADGRLGGLVDVEQAEFGRVLLAEGVGAALGRLHPLVRWDPPVLEIPSHGDGDVTLAGGDLLLAPSAFCWPAPHLYVSLDQRTRVLVYPAVRDLRQAAQLWGDPAGPPHAALAALLGRTRAAVLEAVAAGPVSTTVLARRANVSAPSASQHATALRAANLIVSQRSGTSMLHSVTPLGRSMLDGVTVGHDLPLLR
ncbi:ArsR/SmtB family transcription factor [Catellatospora citrea]|uniref:Transcriptional regulator n=1 Tax=Catellatospora citrea TaxID=53366 RepID=A0A8J3P230_9ACTN|nr:winged helix-turn-helix domain-containing protein [Catellatospora citrea]RKE06263.1 helix-turn-helix protein [Catellatospora citrea]GIG00603.1 transcriptional regulator [Catellatospora citrea]